MGGGKGAFGADERRPGVKGRPQGAIPSAGDPQTQSGEQRGNPSLRAMGSKRRRFGMSQRPALHPHLAARPLRVCAPDRSAGRWTCAVDRALSFVPLASLRFRLSSPLRRRSVARASGCSIPRRRSAAYIPFQFTMPTTGTARWTFPMWTRSGVPRRPRHSPSVPFSDPATRFTSLPTGANGAGGQKAQREARPAEKRPPPQTASEGADVPRRKARVPRASPPLPTRTALCPAGLCSRKASRRPARCGFALRRGLERCLTLPLRCSSLARSRAASPTSKASRRVCYSFGNGARGTATRWRARGCGRGWPERREREGGWHLHL